MIPFGSSATLQATTTLSGKVKQTVYNVRDYGAKGDGSTDDTTAFNSANTAATATNGLIYVPHGTYIINPSNLNTISASFMGESMLGTVLKIVNSFNATQNLLRVVSVSNITVGKFTLDGNKANVAGGIQFGLYISTTTDCGVMNTFTKNFTGDGTQFYNNTRLSTFNCHSTANNYHSFEYEQNKYCAFTNMFGYASTLHDHLVSPGEVGGTGSKGNVFTNLVSNSAGQYGLDFNAANGDVSAWLSEGDTFNGVSIINPTQYGLQIYKQDKMTFNNVYITGAGYFSIYLFESQYNTFNNIFLHNGSQASNGSYDEVFVEGYTSNNSHPSINNTFNGGQILIDGATKARYAFNEGNSHDGPNTFVNINIPNAGTSGKINQLATGDIISTLDGLIVPSFKLTGGSPGSGKILTSDSVGVASWTASTIISRSINSISSNTSAGSTAYTDYVYLASGTTTLTLPTAVGNTNLYTVKNTGSNTVTIATTSAQTIDGSSSATLPVANTSLSLISDNANWRVV